jgi:DNA-binding GntR family transcriptional regulator
MPDGIEDRQTASEGPLYVALARRLKADITNGTYPVGSRLPTEAELGARFSVGRHTVREALRLLRDDGLVSSRQGAGSTVSAPRVADGFVLNAGSINDLLAYATEMHTEIESTRLEVVEGKRAARIGVQSGNDWLVVRGIVRSERRQAPLCWSEYYINREFAAIGRLLPRHVGPIFLLIEELFGLNIVEIDQEITGGIIPRVLAASLKVEPRATAIEVRRSFKTNDGRIAQITLHTHPASRFRQTMTMRRMKS